MSANEKLNRENNHDGKNDNQPDNTLEVEKEVVQEQQEVGQEVADQEVTQELQETEAQQAEQAHDELQASEEVEQEDQQSPKSSNKVWMFVSLILAILLVFSLVKPPFQNGNAAVATVNGVDIGKDKLYDALVKLGGAQTLDGMITEELLQQELDKAKITLTDADYDKELEKVKKSFATEEEFNAALQQNSMTLDVLKEQIKSQTKISKLLASQVKVTDEDIKKVFDENKASFDTPEQIRASHILVSTKEEAEAILKQLKGGADFAKLASEKSMDTNSKDTGGDLNFFAKGQLDPDVEAVAFTKKVNEMAIVQSSGGFHVILITDHKDAHVATLEEKKESIKESLVNSKLSELSGPWFEEVRAKAKITNTLVPAAAATEEKVATKE